MTKDQFENLLEDYGLAYHEVTEYVTSKSLEKLEFTKDAILDVVFGANSDAHADKKEHRTKRIHTNRVKPQKLMKSLDTYCNMYTLGPYVNERNGVKYVKYRTSPVPRFYKKIASKKFRQTAKHVSSPHKSIHKKYFDYKWTVD